MSNTPQTETIDCKSMHNAAEKLWDTSDMFKPTTLDDYKRFYAYVMRRSAERIGMNEAGVIAGLNAVDIFFREPNAN